MLQSGQQVSTRHGGQRNDAAVAGDDAARQRAAHILEHVCRRVVGVEMRAAIARQGADAALEVVEALRAHVDPAAERHEARMALGDLLAGLEVARRLRSIQERAEQTTTAGRGS